MAFWGVDSSSKIFFRPALVNPENPKKKNSGLSRFFSAVGREKGISELDSAGQKNLYQYLVNSENYHYLEDSQ